MNNNQPVFFSTWGFLYAPPVDISDLEIETAINEYLVTKGDEETELIVPD